MGGRPIRGSDFAALTMTALPRSKCYVGQVGGAQASVVVRQRNTIRLAKTFRPFGSLAPLWCCQAAQRVLAIFHICRAT
jgi:hypothetical protein